MTQAAGTIGTEKRLCGACGFSKPLDAFRRTASDGRRAWQCKACFNRYMIEYRSARRKRDMGRCLSKLNQLRGDPRRTEVIARAMLTKFGGLPGLIDEWWRRYSEAKAAGKHYLALRALSAVLFTLNAVGEAREERQSSLSGMNQDEVQGFLDRHVCELLECRPALVLRAAASLGWTVSAPNDDILGAKNNYEVSNG